MTPYIFVLSVVVFTYTVTVNFLLPYDNSDDIENKIRSGMSVYTDHLTGCQYLSLGRFNALTPRYKNDSEQAGCKDDYKAMMKRNHEKRKSSKQIFTDWIEGL